MVYNTICELRKMLEADLSLIPHYVEYSEHVSTEYRGKKIMGSHITVGFSIHRPSLHLQKQVVKVFRKRYSASVQRKSHSRYVAYAWNEEVKSELCILV